MNCVVNKAYISAVARCLSTVSGSAPTFRSSRTTCTWPLLAANMRAVTPPWPFKLTSSPLMWSELLGLLTDLDLSGSSRIPMRSWRPSLDIRCRAVLNWRSVTCMSQPALIFAYVKNSHNHNLNTTPWRTIDDTAMRGFFAVAKFTLLVPEINYILYLHE